MTFNDNDLKRLKEALASRPHSSADCISVCSQVSEGLIARLEAAETRGNHAMAFILSEYKDFQFPCRYEIDNADRAWRKAAGK